MKELVELLSRTSFIQTTRTVILNIDKIDFHELLIEIMC